MVCRSEEHLLRDPNWGDIVYLADVAWHGMKQEEGERKNMSGAGRGGLSTPKVKPLKQPAQQYVLCQLRVHDQSLCILNLKGRNFKEGLRCQLCGLDGHVASVCNEYIQRVAEKKNKSVKHSQVGVKPMNLLQQVRFINFIKRKGIKTQNTNRALIKLSRNSHGEIPGCTP